MAKRALCIGINNYPGMQNDLSGCINDVRDWSAALKARDFTVTTLTDSNATKKNMEQAIGKLMTDTQVGDVAVLQYSGHGSYVADADADENDGRDECLCPYDVNNAVITDDELYDLFDKAPKGARVVFLSDSCHSGTVMRVAPAVGVTAKPTKPRFLPPSAFLDAREARRAAAVSRSTSTTRPLLGVLISGCQDVQTSADAWFGNRANGAFTYYALQALKGLKKTATYRDWHRAIRKLLPNTSYDQRPNLFASNAQRMWPVL